MPGLWDTLTLTSPVYTGTCFSFHRMEVLKSRPNRSRGKKGGKQNQQRSSASIVLPKRLRYGKKNRSSHLCNKNKVMLTITCLPFCFHFCSILAHLLVHREVFGKEMRSPANCWRELLPLSSLLIIFKGGVAIAYLFPRSTGFRIHVTLLLSSSSQPYTQS